MTSLERALSAFAQFAAKLKGDEKSEAQTFLFHLLEAFGHDPNTLPEGATFEYRVRFVGGGSDRRDGKDDKDESSGPLTPALSQGERGNRRQSSRGSVSGGGSSPGDRTKFADLVWPGRCLIEMKSRGVKLSKHYQQTFDYWLNLVPHRPPFVALCDFDEFWIYDFNTQLQEPVDRVKVSELAARHSALNFLFPRPFAPIFGNNRSEERRVG